MKKNIIYSEKEYLNLKKRIDALNIIAREVYAGNMRSEVLVFAVLDFKIKFMQDNPWDISNG